MDAREQRYKDAKHHLLTAIMLCCPTGKEQQAFTKLTATLERGETAKTVVTQLASRLVDGLRFDNWPERK